MNIKEAVDSLTKHLNDEEAFTVYPYQDSIVIDVNYIYRVDEIMNEVEKLNGEWGGFPIKLGRRSCW